MNYQFKATRRFWKSFDRLTERQKTAARAAWKLFEQNPFDPSLRPHKIHRLTAEYGVTVYAACVESDLRVAFFVEGNTVWSVDIGTHALYRA